MSRHDRGPAAGDGFTEVAFYYGLWRKIANAIGEGPYEEPDWQDGRLYLRFDYWDKLREWPEWGVHGDWAAWIIAPTPQGLFCVLHSLLHERASQRSEKLEALFARALDAGKYVISRMGDSLRSHLRLETLFMKWDAPDFHSRLIADSATREVVDLLCDEMSGLDREFAEQHLKRYSLPGDASSFGFALPSEKAYMEVLAFSCEELTAALLEGMPESIISLASQWRQQKGDCAK